MRKGHKSWTPEELTQLPSAMQGWKEGVLSRQKLQAMFNYRTLGAIRLKYDKMPRTNGHSQPALNPNGSRPLRELKVIENDRIVVYKEVVTV